MKNTLQFNRQLNSSVHLLGQYKGTHIVSTFKCRLCNGEFTSRPSHIMSRAKIDAYVCPLCHDSGKYLPSAQEKLVGNGYTIVTAADTVRSGTQVTVRFKCGHIQQFVAYTLRYNKPRCQICKNPSLIIDNFIAQVKSTFGNKVKTNVEIDDKRYHIVINNKIAINLLILNNCVEQKVGRYFVRDNLVNCPMPLIQIFEDEWLNNHDLILSKIAHYAQINVVPLIHTRKCHVNQISAVQCNKLLNTYHTQGAGAAQLRYGLFSTANVLVAVMTFSKPRVAVGHKGVQNKLKFELCRFATNTNYRIPGAAGKLLSHFLKNNQWTEIYSYADRRWSVGNMYHQLGFNQQIINGPDYFYIVDNVRKHRWNYRKDKLKELFNDYDPQLTEYQMMRNHGYDRVWGCGTIKYVLSVMGERV